MALIKCSECGKEISDKEIKCNNCKKESIVPFLKKTGIVFTLSFILLIISFNFLQATLEKNSNFEYELKQDEKIIHDFNCRGTMVAYGENGVSITPINAYIKNGKIYVKGNLKNNTGINIKFKDYGIVSADYTSTIFSTDYEDEKIINNGEEAEIEFSLGAYDVMVNGSDFPNIITFEIGGYNLNNNNYLTYNLKFYISWLNNDNYY